MYLLDNISQNICGFRNVSRGGGEDFEAGRGVIILECMLESYKATVPEP
jgi:hypothetical protein